MKVHQERFILTPKQVSVLLGRKIKTLEEDRAKRKQADDPSTIDPRSYASLPFIPPSKDDREIQYRASDVIELLDRRTGGPQGSALMRGAPSHDSPEVRGFQSWLSYGSAAEEWPFCIQPDGRPMPMAQAIATGCLTDNAVRLNLREYTERLAEAASKGFISDETEELEKTTSATSEAAGPKGKRDRWNKPGGPI